MEQAKAKAVELPGHNDPFRSLADSHRADVRRIRESNRQRRLRYLLYLNVLVFAYLVKRALEARPLALGWPQLGADAWVWLFPVLILLTIVAMMLLPLANGRSPHVRVSPEEIDVDFSDVKGIDVVLEEVTRSLQIFLTYKSFKEELGGNPRRGILFEGAPGTGKTHLAKAMAAEAGVPFFFISAPAFQSMWFGMTARRIRAFFKAMKKAARKEGGAIGFIEEIDAIGTSRGGVETFSPGGRGLVANRMVSQGSGGMVNELLIQMQSFDTPLFWGRVRNTVKDVVNTFLPGDHQVRKKAPPYSNVLLIAATNRADSLDPALMRPGRFDRSLYFDLPSLHGRRELVDYFLAKRAHESEMDEHHVRAELASMTLGYTPAMLEHVLDEALVWALRDGRRALSWRDVQRARLSEEIGLAQPVAYTEGERKVIATHEAGHAVIAYLCAKDRRLEVLSIIKRRKALGMLAHSDVEERFTKSKSELEGTLKITLGGMSAEEIFFGEWGTGPASDLLTATTLAAQMIGSLGMGNTLISYDAADSGAYSRPNTVAKVLSDEEGKGQVDELLRRARAEVMTMLRANRHLVEALRDALLQQEELMGDEILDVLREAQAASAG